MKAGAVMIFRPRFAYSLRTLLVLLTIAGIWFGWQFKFIRQRRATLETISWLDSQVVFADQTLIGTPILIPTWRIWLGDRPVQSITLPYGQGHDPHQLLAIFPEAAIRLRVGGDQEGWSQSGLPHNMITPNQSVVELLSSDEPSERAKALRDLARLGKSAGAVAPKIVELLDDSHPFVRRQAIVTLGSTGIASESVWPKVERMFLDHDPAVSGDPPHSAQAIDTLPGFGAVSFGLLAALANEGASGANTRSIANPMQEPTKAFHEDDGDDCEVRISACKALGKLRDARGVEVLLTVLKAAENTTPATDLIGRLTGSPPSKPWGDRHRRAVAAAIKGLGDLRVGNKEVLAALTKHKAQFPDETDTATRKIQLRAEVMRREQSSRRVE